MDREDESLYFLDMTACEPGDAFSTEFEKGKWTAVEYAMAQGPGKMVFCGPDTQASPIRLKLGVKGWHHVFVGTYRNPHYPDSCLLLRLSGDAGYTRAVTEDFRPGKDLVAPEMLPKQTDLCEAYWRSADLTGQDVIFHRPAAGQMAETITNIAYLRLTPLSAAEQARAERDRTDTRRLIANYDSGQHDMWSYGTDQEMADEFQALAQSDFKMVLWGCAGSFATFYPSRVGSEMRWSFGLPGYMRLGWQAVDRYRRHGFDPLRAAVRRAHEVGVEVYAQVRMIGEQLPPNHRGYVGPGDFQMQHPEFRCLTREGHRTRHLSQAFPEVRAKYVDLFREWVEDYGADGVCIIFCRSWPYVLYEGPVVRSFQERHGVDMRGLDRFDERVLSHRAGYVTALLQETRHMLDEVGAKVGRRLGTCYVVPADRKAADAPDMGPFTGPKSHGMDVETWVREGLVDHLVVHVEGVGRPDASDRVGIFRSYAELCRGTGVQVYADLYPRRQSGDSMRVRAMACYEAGVDGLCFWDSHRRAQRLSGWAMHRVLGHREDLGAPEMERFAKGLFRVVPMTSLDGFMIQEENCLPSDG
ncbi:MAG: hypothetical protein A3F84_15105 [Candidatus Handelsmanbacteria bacterium RIFCSPLOWO2_12_FULL_64_10]|uniref:Glycosyl hydrolase-like 10 domain-containing protein n=1 Tax=Handelsmanbacteria sp. (strain RIFCSPLOWO2_12_FULL_64_10) TaxID=1817868 RepID=A0A1F6CAI3_HANXR|nr:MAG: hypothetical protein A3F84_15105 [Candidatus Handelsmanbacteria bacterium RIFCSPLOWO2_12_FULL_64_10]